MRGSDIRGMKVPVHYDHFNTLEFTRGVVNILLLQKPVTKFGALKNIYIS